MHKFILCFVLICATTLYGFICSYKLTKRKKSLRSICDGILRVRSLVSFGGYEILRVLHEGFKDIDVFKAITDLHPYAFSDEFFILLKNELCLNKDDVEVFRNFTDILGVTDTEGQIANCDLCYELMKKQLESAEEKEQSSGRLYKILGFSLGSVITLMIV